MDKVCREGREVHRENRMICSVQGLCIDLVYLGPLAFSTGVGVFSLFPVLFEASFYLTIQNRFSKRDRIALCFYHNATSIPRPSSFFCLKEIFFFVFCLFFACSAGNWLHFLPTV